MGRFLFVVPPLTGHTNPTLPLGRELRDRGHAVAWTGHPREVAELLPDWAMFLPVTDAPDEIRDVVLDNTAKGTRGLAGFMRLWEDFVLPIARQMLPDLRKATEAFAPDVLVVDQLALAGAVVAEQRALPWATSATTSADLVDPLAALPQAADWLHTRTRDLLVEGGLDPDRAARLDPRYSPHLLLAFTSAEMVGAPEGFPDHYALVGPLIGDRPDDTPFPWAWLDDAGTAGPDGRRPPVVLVTLGSVNWRSGARFFAVAAEALAGMPVRAILVAPDDAVPEPPPNVLVVPRVPQLALLPHVDAVVCHGGHNTVCEALAEGLPLVLAPMRDDQPVVAEQVARAGAGIRVKYGRVTAAELRRTIESVLTEPAYREAAGGLRASFAAAGGAPAAADRLEALLVAAPGAAHART